MFVALSSLFVAVALVSLGAIAEAAQQCQSYPLGSTRPPTFPVPVNDNYLEPYKPVYDYNVEPGGCPVGSFHVGTLLEACDEGIAPIVNFRDLSYAKITRPNPVATGVVHGEIFCQYYFASSSGAKPYLSGGAKPSLSGGAENSPSGGASAADLPRVEVRARQ